MKYDGAGRRSDAALVSAGTPGNEEQLDREPAGRGWLHDEESKLTPERVARPAMRTRGTARAAVASGRGCDGGTGEVQGAGGGPSWRRRGDVHPQRNVDGRPSRNDVVRGNQRAV